MPFYTRIKRLLVGKPIATKHAHHERLTKLFGLPIFASDALSSVAYATEECLRILVLGGIAALFLLTPISIALATLLVLVGFSYYQTIQAYPKGGGTYLVSTQNLGSVAGRIAGAALLIDYVLTVSVSISSGVDAVTSAFPENALLRHNAVLLGCLCVAVIAIVNLRGTRESGAVFAVPTYSFVGLVLFLVACVIVRSFGEPAHAPNPSSPIFPSELHPLGILLALRAFAAVCTALTGTEAIADGVQAFRPPESRNAGLTLVAMVILLLAMFLGISYSALHLGILPDQVGTHGFQTVLAQIATKQWGHGGLFFALQTATFLILFLAANTAFADFPRLSSFMARDGFMPRQLSSVGDRLVFQNGIVLLAMLSMSLIVIFKGSTHSLIPLYALGVFISFTMSQTGMVVKFRREGAATWKWVVSSIGAVVTGVVMIILLITKFEEGAWIIVLALCAMLVVFKMIRGHYDYLANELSISQDDKIIPVKSTVLLLVPRMHRGILRAISYAQSITSDVRAIHVTLDGSSAAIIKKDWNQFGLDMPLVILESPYRSLIEPITEYIDQALAEEPNHMITVIVPQAVPKRWYQGLLHNNVAVPLKIALASRRNVVVTNVRYFLK